MVLVIIQTFLKLEPTHPLYKMVYNHYYGGVFTHYGNGLSELYRFSEELDVDKRTDRQVMIYPKLLKDGDILLYENTYQCTKIDNDNNGKPGKCIEGSPDRKTHERGEYAFIYLDGKFVGRNKIYPENNTEDLDVLYSGYENNLPEACQCKLQENSNICQLVRDDTKWCSSSKIGDKEYKPYAQCGIYEEFGDLFKIFGKDFYVILRPSLDLNK